MFKINKQLKSITLVFNNGKDFNIEAKNIHWFYLHDMKKDIAINLDLESNWNVNECWSAESIDLLTSVDRSLADLVTKQKIDYVEIFYTDGSKQLISTFEFGRVGCLMASDYMNITNEPVIKKKG